MSQRAERSEPKIFRLPSESESSSTSSTEAEFLSDQLPIPPMRSGRSSEISDNLDEDLETALLEEGYQTQELEESIEDEEEQPPKSPTPKPQFHLLIHPPGGSPTYKTFENLEELLESLYSHIELAIQLRELAAWRVYVFEGSRLDIVGDLQNGLVAIKRRGVTVTLPTGPLQDTVLPAGMLSVPDESPVEDRQAKITSVFDMDSDNDLDLF